MQCYYCCKRGYRANDCKLWERAKKIRKNDRKKSSKDDTAVNTAIATNTTTTTNVVVATIADAEIWACNTSSSTAKDYDFQKAWHLDLGAIDHICNDKSAFLEIQRLPKPIKVRIGDDSIVPSYGNWDCFTINYWKETAPNRAVQSALCPCY